LVESERNLRPGVNYAFAAVIGAGTVINPLIKVVTTLIILGAVYLFIVKPALDTTNNAIEKGSEISNNAIRQGEQQIHDSNFAAARAQLQSYEQSLQSSWPEAARAVRACAQEHGDDLAAFNRCDDFAQRIIQTVESDRQFALSYADSLGGADAQRVRACVKQAGFETAAMQRCRDLADHLLFG
jgi:hypothetical protein